MILAPSLIPSPRLINRRKRHRIRGWAGGIVLTGLVGGAGSIAAQTWMIAPGSATHLDVARAEQRLVSMTAKRDSLKAELASASATLYAISSATDHADWSILLAFIAKLCGDRIILDTLSLEPDPMGLGFDLKIKGEGLTQRDIATFVLGLERSGVFATSRLDNSGGASATTGIPFSVTCLIRPNGITTTDEEDGQ